MYEFPVAITSTKVTNDKTKEIDVNVVVIIGTPLPNCLPKIRPLKNPNNGKSKMVSSIF